MYKSKYSNTFVLKSLGLPYFNDIDQFSEITGLSVPLIFNLSQRTERQYKTKKIHKKSGGIRLISSPNYSMKIVQRWILKNILEKIMLSDRATAFRTGTKYGIVQNANFHKNSLYTISVDITNFFTSIVSERVYFLFKSLGYNNYSATLLSNLCTLDGVLPQGGVCSPTISNLICTRLDNRLVGLCGKRGIIYSRYADDMCFSSDNKDLLNKTLPVIRKIIEDEDFELNESKTKYLGIKNRKIITGIVVTKEGLKGVNKLRAPRDKKQQIRAAIHKAIVTGDYSNRDKILGLISFIDFVERKANSSGLSFKEKMKIYIKKCAEKISIYEEVVNKYNDNLFFKDLVKIEYRKFADPYTADNEVESFYEYNTILKLNIEI